MEKAQCQNSRQLLKWGMWHEIPFFKWLDSNTIWVVPQPIKPFVMSLVHLQWNRFARYENDKVDHLLKVKILKISIKWIDWQLIVGWGTDSSSTELLNFTIIPNKVFVSYINLNYPLLNFWNGFGFYSDTTILCLFW